MPVLVGAVPPGQVFGQDRRFAQSRHVRFFGDTFRILLVFFHRIHPEIFFLHLRQILAFQIGNGELAEDVVDDRRRHLDAIVELDRTIGLESGEDKCLDKFFERHTVLQAERDRDGEIVHQAAERRTFLVHVEKDFAERPVFVLAGAKI